MTALLHCLVGDVAAALDSTALSGQPLPHRDSEEIVARLSRSGLLDIPDLIALLLQRADQDRIGTAARARSGRGEPRMVQGLVSFEDAEIAAAAMGLVIARGRRRDRFGNCLALLDDVSPDAAIALVHAVAAALRSTGADSASAQDPALSSAAADVISRHDEARGENALAQSLAARLAHLPDWEEQLLVAAADGEPAILGFMLAERARVPGQCGVDALLSGDVADTTRLFRLAGVGRETFGRFVASVGDLFGVTDAAAAMHDFDSLEEGDISRHRAWLSASPQYRTAAERLGAGRG